MMKADRVVFDVPNGVVLAAGAITDDVLRVVARGIDELDVVAGDDVSMRVTAGRVDVESLSDHPLVVLHAADDDVTVRVRTLFGPDAAVEPGGLKDGVPVVPLDE